MRSITTAMILVFGAFPALDAAEVQIISIQPKRDGAKVVWQSAAEGFAFTLQERNSLTSGAWRDVRTRYRWPTIHSDSAVLRIARGGRPTARFFRVLAEPIQPPERGKLLSSEVVHQWSLTQIRGFMRSEDVATDPAVWPVHYYKITYETVDPFGLPIIASGGLFIPQGMEEPLPVVSYQHGTEIYKPWVPSQDDSFWFPIATTFVSSGNVTVMPDYLGLGDSPGLHPWLHAKTEAPSVVDLLRAVKTFCADNNIALNTQLFLAGVSQGGASHLGGTS